MASYDRDTIARLADDIVRHKKLYYRGLPEISDQNFDALEARLRQLSPNHPALLQVGADDDSAGKKIEHSRPMLSLAKTYSQSELFSWAKDEPLMATLKIDGNSLSLVYVGGELVQAKTRGNGRLGEDVLAKIRWVSDCVPSMGPKERVEVRGELYCTEIGFLQLVEEMTALGLERPTNPRNTVAGILGRKQYASLARYFSFAAFDVLGGDGNAFLPSETAKFDWLSKRGFRLPMHRPVRGIPEIEAFLALSKEFMEDGEFAIDGAVFTFDRVELHTALGDTSHHPRYRLSFKWQGETAIARITGFTWSTSRLGIVTPVAVIEPVYLSGASISNVTLHNAQHVKLFNLKVGDEIEIVRSGEVIPKFLRVVTEGNGTCQWPDRCSSCGSELKFDDVRLFCPNRSACPAQRIGTILNWIKNVEIDDLSEKRLVPLVEMGLVNHASDLYRLTVDDLLRLPMTKGRLAEKLWANIQKSRECPLANFLNGLGIAGAGLSTWEALLADFPSLEAIQAMSVNDVVQVEGFAEKSALQIVSGLTEKANDIAKLLEAGVHPKAPQKGHSGVQSEISGKTLVITGTMSRPRDELEKAIKAVGGKVSGAVSKATYALVIDDINSTSTKARKAKELGIPLWSEDELIRHLESVKNEQKSAGQM